MAHHQALVFTSSLLCLTLGEKGVEYLTECSPHDDKFRLTQKGCQLRNECKMVYFGFCFVLFFCMAMNNEPLLLHPTTFVVLGAVCYTRSFGSKHELNHTPGAANVSNVPSTFLGWLLRCLDIPCGPLHMGLDDLTATHKLHHRAHHPQLQNHRYPDPDAYLIETGWVASAFHCFFESEQSVIRHVVRSRGKQNLVQTLLWIVYKTMVLAVVWYSTRGRNGLYYWLLASRIGNFFSMFAFHKVLHEEIAYTAGIPAWTGCPAVVYEASRILLGQDITNGICYHHVHHADSSIPARFLNDIGCEAIRMKSL